MTLFSSTAAPPHDAPPSVAGKKIVFFVILRGINGCPVWELRSSAIISSLFDAHSFTSFSVNDCLTNGKGQSGMGCVFEVCSPTTSEAGKGLSSIGKIGLPVTRSKTNIKPSLLKIETTSRFLPFCVIVNKLGGAGISRSQMS